MTPAFRRARFHSLQDTVGSDGRRVAAATSLPGKSTNESSLCSNDFDVTDIGSDVFAGVEAD
jgi:hypothetical protein